MQEAGTPDIKSERIANLSAWPPLRGQGCGFDEASGVRNIGFELRNLQNAWTRIVTSPSGNHQSQCLPLESGSAGSAPARLLVSQFFHSGV